MSYRGFTVASMPPMHCWLFFPCWAALGLKQPAERGFKRGRGEWEHQRRKTFLSPSPLPMLGVQISLNIEIILRSLYNFIHRTPASLFLFHKTDCAGMYRFYFMLASETSIRLTLHAEAIFIWCKCCLHFIFMEISLYFSIT